MDWKLQQIWHFAMFIEKWLDEALLLGFKKLDMTALYDTYERMSLEKYKSFYMHFMKEKTFPQG